jgi:hypothetical protein
MPRQQAHGPGIESSSREHRVHELESLAPAWFCAQNGDRENELSSMSGRSVPDRRNKMQNKSGSRNATRCERRKCEQNQIENTLESEQGLSRTDQRHEQNIRDLRFGNRRPVRATGPKRRKRNESLTLCTELTATWLKIQEKWKTDQTNEIRIGNQKLRFKITQWRTHRHSSHSVFYLVL